MTTLAADVSHAPRRHRHLPLLGHRGLDAPARAARRPRTATSSATTGGSCATSSSAPAARRWTRRATRSSSRSRARATPFAARSRRSARSRRTSGPTASTVKVRMGLHTGEPTVGDEGYLGMDVVRAARICSAGHGGQILLSETTRALVGNELPEGAEIRDLGEAQLKDVQHERIFQLALAERAGRVPAAEDGRAPSRSADELAREIERRVHEQILAASTSRARARPTKLAKLAVVGLLLLALLVVAAVAIFLIVRALLWSSGRRMAVPAARRDPRSRPHELARRPVLHRDPERARRRRRQGRAARRGRRDPQLEPADAGARTACSSCPPTPASARSRSTSPHPDGLAALLAARRAARMSSSRACGRHRRAARARLRRAARAQPAARLLLDQRLRARRARWPAGRATTRCSRARRGS